MVETVVERLAELRPDVYSGWAPAQLTAALKPYGITTGQVWNATGEGRGANRRGIDRADVEKAAAVATAAIAERGRRTGAANTG